MSLDLRGRPSSGEVLARIHSESRDQSESGIVNDPNGWFEQPEDLITAIRRIVHVSVETTATVSTLPESLPTEEQAAVTKRG